ncbi:peptidoglycan D,D-transpeptidase FtsI family protein [Dellaglioa sp. L3N]
MKLPKAKQGRSKQNKSHIPFRLNFLFFIVFLLFAALLVQLAYLQILNGASFEATVNSTDTTTETKNVQRGMVYDSTGKVLVGNNSSRAITYTKGSGVLSTDLYKIANHLVTYVSIDTSKLTDRNAADYYLANTKHLATVTAAVKKEKKLTSAQMTKLTSVDFNTFAVAYVVEHNINALTDQEKEAAVIFSKMSGAYSLSTVYLKTSNVTDKEMAEVGEHLSGMPGIKIGTNWSRSYPNGKSMNTIIGNVTSESTGLPSDSIETLMSEGYSRNDSVGQSYLEKQYENVLKGTKSQTKMEVANSKIVKQAQEYSGKKGDNLVLNINAKFQAQVQKIMKDSVTSIAGSNPYNPGAYAVVMNPHTGAVYAMSGVSRNIKTGKITDDALGSINQVFTMGSVVKGATVMGAMMDGVITPTSNTLTDEPIKLAGTATKSSWFNASGAANVALTASDALMVSSNSYMMQLAMKEGGFNYSSGSSLDMSNSIFSKMRGYFNQFGLGVKTGVDLPGESTGFEGVANQTNIGKALDLSFGNYDSYTTIQLAQYMSTMANGGTRLQPQIVKAIRSTNADGSLGSVQTEMTPNVLSTVNATKPEFDVVKSGLYKVVHGTNPLRTGGTMSTATPSISAKTGTAQTFYGTTETEALSLASYAPSNDPKVVVALVFPGMVNNTGSAINSQAALKIYSAFWKTVESSK